MARQSTLPTRSVEAARDYWLTKRARSQATRRAYERTYDLFAAHLAAHGVPLDDLDGIEGADIEDFIESFPTESTRKLRYYSLRSMFTANKRFLTAHPFDMIDTPEWSKPERRRHLSWDDLYRMLDTTRRDVARKVNNGHRDRAMLELMATSGLRRSEVAGLELRDIDGQTITVRREVGKGDKERTARMDPAAAESVAEYVDIIRGRPGSRRGHHARDYASLFLGLAGPMSGQGVGDVVTRRAGLARLDPPPTAHELRALWKMTAVDCRISRESVEALAGWMKASEMFDHYASIDRPRQAAEEYDRLWQRPARRPAA